MIDVTPMKNLKGAERFGECTACGSTKYERYRIIMTPRNSNASTSIRMCEPCMRAFAETVLEDILQEDS